MPAPLEAYTRSRRRCGSRKKLPAKRFEPGDQGTLGCACLGGAFAAPVRAQRKPRQELAQLPQRAFPAAPGAIPERCGANCGAIIIALVHDQIVNVPPLSTPPKIHFVSMPLARGSLDHCAKAKNQKRKKGRRSAVRSICMSLASKKPLAWINPTTPRLHTPIWHCPARIG